MSTQAIYMYIITKFDKELSETQPLAFARPTEETPESLAAVFKDAGLKAARRYDRYNHITQVSMEIAGKTTHYILDTSNSAANQAVKPITNHYDDKVFIYPDEGAMLKDVYTDIDAVPPMPIVSWEANVMWAKLVNKWLRYRVPVAAHMVQDPYVRYATNKLLYSLANIYQQALPPSIRPIPDYVDALEYWNIQVPESPYGEYWTTDQLSTVHPDKWADPEHPVHGHAKALLAAMPAIINMYSGDENDYMQSMPGADDAGARGPKPQ